MYYDFINTANDSTLLTDLGFCPIKIDPIILNIKTSNELKNEVYKAQNCEFLVIKTQNLVIAQQAIKNCMADAVDIPPDYKSIRMLKEKNIAILMNFNELLRSNDLGRTIYQMRKKIRLAKKYKAPIILTSGASSKYEQRGASELLAFGEFLNLRPKEAKNALFFFQEQILERNKLKKQGKWVSYGVKVV